MKHLCDDVCFKKFRSNPTEYLRAAPTAKADPKPTAAPTPNQNQQKQAQAQKQAPGAPPPVSSVMMIYTLKPNIIAVIILKLK